MITPTPDPRRPDRSRAGFTLVELLVAVTLGAVLVIALAHSTTLFGSQVEAVTTDLDTSLEETLGEISSAVRTGWLVEPDGTTTLDVTDALGDVTSYAYDEEAKAVTVTRPGGAVGTVLEGVKSIEFDVGRVQRLREDEPLETYGEYFTQALAGEAESYFIEVKGSSYLKKATSPYFSTAPVQGLYFRDEAVALGFTVAAAAPAEIEAVDGVTEELLEATLDRIVLPIAHLPELPSLPVQTKAAKASKTKTKGNKSKSKVDKGKSKSKSGGGSGGDSGKGDDSGGTGGDGGSKGDTAPDGLTIWHFPSGNPDHSISIKLKTKAALKHLKSPNYQATPPPVDPSGSGNVQIELYEARGQDDARPYGGLIGSVSLPADSLPLATYDWVGINYVDPTTGEKASYTKGKKSKSAGKKSAGKKVPTKAAKKAAGGGGSKEGDDSGGSKSKKSKTKKSKTGKNKTPSPTIKEFEYDNPRLQVYPPTVEVPIDLFDLGADLEPGVPYTLVMRYQGSGFCVVRKAGSPSASYSGVATNRDGGTSFSKDSMEVPLSFDGMRTYTQAQEFETVVRVTTTIELEDGRRLASSSIVASQAAVTNPWYGQVDGELPTLQLEGQ